MKPKRTVLKNGLRIVSVPMKDTPTVTVLVMVEAGSKYETKEISGLSHFLEHMCFKGTTERPSALAISKELESIGSQYNAFTTEEYTGYYAKAAAKHAETILDVVSDLYLNQVFPEPEIEKEKGVIVEELNMYKDLPHRHVQELFMKVLYGDQPVGWGVGGFPETVKNMKRDDFIEYRNKHYVASATTIFIAGNYDEKALKKAIQKKFAHISTGKKAGKIKVKEVQSEPQIIIEERKTDQTHIILGVRAFPAGHKSLPAARIMNAVLGAGMSSRLFQRLREEMGVGYYVRSYYDTYTDHGILSVSIGCDNKRVLEVIQAIITELNRFKLGKVPEDELNKTKEFLIGSLLLGLESSDSVAEFYGNQEMLRQSLKTPQDVIKEIKAVTAADIQAVAKKLFVDKALNMAMVGPAMNEADIKAILHF